MKVLHVSPSFYPSTAYGGTIRSGYGLCRGLAELGCDVRVLSTDSDGIGHVLDVTNNWDQQIDSFRVRYCHKWFRHSISPSLLWTLPSYVQWANVVHLTAVYSFPTFPALFWARRFRKPIVWSTRGALQRWDGSSRPALKWIWESACQRLAVRSKLILHATSQLEAERNSERFPDLRTVVIPNGIDLPKNPQRTDSNGKLRLLYLGRLDPIKGVDALLEACAIVERLELDWQLNIAGSGMPTYIKLLKSKVQELGLSQRVRFVGEVSGRNKEVLFTETDVLVLPSHVENFAIVVAESLAHAIPVIASKGTPWKGLETNHCGLWVDNHPESLAAAIRGIQTMPLREMGQQGRRWVEEAFSWRTVSNEMLALYRECSHLDPIGRDRTPEQSFCQRLV